MELVKSLEKALQIIEYIANVNNNPTLAQIADNLAMNRATAYRLVHTLTYRGYLIRDEDTNTYRIGLKIIPLAAKYLNTNKLRLESLPYLHELSQKTGERVNLGILDDGEVFYLAGVEKPSLPMVYSRFGIQAPAHACSLGKIILANMSKKELDHQIARRPLKKFTENTITDPHLLKQHLAEIRSQGYAIDNEEHFLGSCCISALIRDSKGHGIGSISISSGDLENIKGRFLKDLQQTAEIISHLMGLGLG